MRSGGCQEENDKAREIDLSTGLGLDFHFFTLLPRSQQTALPRAVETKDEQLRRAAAVTAICTPVRIEWRYHRAITV